MKKRFLSLITIVLAMVMCVFSLTACAGGKDPAPNKGFDIDLAKLVGVELGVEVEFVKIEWKMKEVELAEKKIDLIWNGMTIDDERKAAFEISTPYMTNKQVAVTLKSNLSKYTTLDSIKNASNIAVEHGSAADELCRNPVEPKDEKTTPGWGLKTNINPASDQMMALTEVKQNKSDVAIIDKVMAGYLLQNSNYSDLAIVDVVLAEDEQYGIAARKGDKGTIDKINTALNDLYQDGVVQRLAASYGLEEYLLDLTYESQYNSLSASEKEGWKELAEKKKIVIGYTVYAPIAFFEDVAA